MMMQRNSGGRRSFAKSTSAGGAGSGREMRSFSAPGQSRPGRRSPSTQLAAPRRPRRFRGGGYRRRRPSGRSAGRAPSSERRSADQRPSETAEPTVKELELPEQITVRDLADEMGCSPIELIKQLMNEGVMANINQQIDYDTAAIVAEDMGYKVKELKPPEPEVEEAPVQPVRRRVYSEEEQKYLRVRPPVVTTLGHVDHGKTSLLDVIRATKVQAREAGGITQRVGAYQVRAREKLITFLDTPGHEAFTAMRARGAKVTDIAMLVVSADGGVQPQTLEAIDHARAAQVPIVVALNKMDLATANPELVKQQLAEAGLVVEEWGGDTICVPVSAKTKTDIDVLLDMILLVAEMADLKANPRGKVEGTVIDGRLDRSRGPTGTLLVAEGTLKPGDALLVGRSYGRVRAMFDYQGKRIKRAAPSTPVVVIGLHTVPEAGDKFEVVDDERVAKKLAEQRVLELRERESQPVERLTLDQIYERAQRGAVQTLNLILKADVQGSIEPVRNSLDNLDVGELKVRFVHQGIGDIGESDVMLAIASQAVIIGFNVGVEPSARRMAEAEGVSIRTYDIIYRVIEDIQLALTGMLEPEYQEVIHGRATVRQVFDIPRVGRIAGVQVTEGKALRNSKIRVKRQDEVLCDSEVSSLKRYAENVTEVSAGMECGVGVEGFRDFQEDDILEFYTKEVVE